MHELRLIHTDLKPENILLVSSEFIRVPDHKVYWLLPTPLRSCVGREHFWMFDICCSFYKLTPFLHSSSYHVQQKTGPISRIFQSQLRSSSLILEVPLLNIKITAILFPHVIIGHLKLSWVHISSCSIIVLPVAMPRSLELHTVVLPAGLGWNYPCDLWSVGCILVELCSVSTIIWTIG